MKDFGWAHPTFLWSPIERERTITQSNKGGRPKGMTPAAIEKATIAEALYKNGSIPVKKIAEQLGISKTTLEASVHDKKTCHARAGGQPFQVWQ